MFSWLLIYQFCFIREEKIKTSTPSPMALPPNNVSVSPGTHPSESFYSHLSPSLLATVAASASQSGLSSSSSSPFLNLQDFPTSTIGTSPNDPEGEQGGKDKDTKLKEILSHIYQYVSRQYNQRINENLEDPNGISPNPLKKVSKFTDNNYLKDFTNTIRALIRRA